jgi:hypothetical protein
MDLRFFYFLVLGVQFFYSIPFHLLLMYTFIYVVHIFKTTNYNKYND